MFYLHTQIYPNSISRVIINSSCIEDEPHYKDSVLITRGKAHKLVREEGLEPRDAQCDEVGCVIPLELIYLCETCGAKIPKADYDAGMCCTCEIASI